LIDNDNDAATPFGAGNAANLIAELRCVPLLITFGGVSGCDRGCRTGMK
jgi:hypothetical protein